MSKEKHKFRYSDIKGIKDVQAIKDHGEYYLRVTYECENENRKYDLTFPRIHLPMYSTPIEVKLNRDYHGIETAEIDLGFGMLNLSTVVGNIFWRVDNVQEKTKKMTLSEVEAALGHKVELVSEK